MEKITPKVTIIIPSYNRERFIRKTVDSALSQTYSNIEVVAIDDGSTDSTRNILESYAQRIRILEHEGRSNKGQSASINLGLQITDSDYVGILDSDDVLFPNKIERQVNFLESNKDVDVVYSNAEIIDENDKVLWPALGFDHYENGNPENILLACPMGCPSAFLAKRSAYIRVGNFDESLRSAQDHDMAIRLAEATKLAYLNEVLWYKREHSDSLSGKFCKRRYLAGFIILRKACKRYPYGFSIRRRRLAVLHFRLGQCFLLERRFFAGLWHMCLAATIDPKRGVRIVIGKERAN